MLGVVSHVVTRVQAAYGDLMTAAYVPNPGDIAGRGIANADFDETGRPTVEDHSAHAAGSVCARCGRMIEAEQPARRSGDTAWVHDVCPVVTE